MSPDQLCAPCLVSTRHFVAAPAEKKDVPSSSKLSYKMLVEPSTGVAENLVVEVSLPGVVRS